MEKRSSSGDSGLPRHNAAERCVNGWLHLRTGMKIIIAVGVVVIAALVVLLSLYFRKALFLMAVSSVVTILAAGALFRHDHRFVWPLIGISFFHLFLAIHLTLVFLFFFFFKPLYIIMVFNWAFDTMYASKNTNYYVKCGCIFTALVVFFLLQPVAAEVRAAPPIAALNFSQRETPSPPFSKRSVGGTSAVIFVNGMNGQSEALNGAVRHGSKRNSDAFV
ncbi:hypothetical protein M3Y99_00367800 [Aphelenchoides fujianensis]|nr:hypothetical protein M3Y99_00367800 [Aphelenchoides fujianensis]